MPIDYMRESLAQSLRAGRIAPVSLERTRELRGMAPGSCGYLLLNTEARPNWDTAWLIYEAHESLSADLARVQPQVRRRMEDRYMSLRPPVGFFVWITEELVTRP